MTDTPFLHIECHRANLEGDAVCTPCSDYVAAYLACERGDHTGCVHAESS